MWYYVYVCIQFCNLWHLFVSIRKLCLHSCSCSSSFCGIEPPISSTPAALTNVRDSCGPWRAYFFFLGRDWAPWKAALVVGQSVDRCRFVTRGAVDVSWEWWQDKMICTHGMPLADALWPSKNMHESEDLIVYEICARDGKESSKTRLARAFVDTKIFAGNGGNYVDLNNVKRCLTWTPSQMNILQVHVW